jgi:glycosyltransferase involved in cell wall biosynthesis
MKIGIVIGRIGGIDGVALEAEKWIAVLERLGHRVLVLAGKLEGPVQRVTLLPELSFDHPLAVAGQEAAFFGGTGDEAGLAAALRRQSRVIERGILEWIDRQGIQCLVSENASALPCHLTMGMGLQQVYQRTGIRGVTHDHDFWWERPGRYDTPFRTVRQVIGRCFPVKLANVKHAVINSAARRELRERFGIDDAVVVPNVMDFDQPFGQPDDYNARLPADLGLEPGDLPLFQVTRIVRRKGIETAIDLVHRLRDPRVKLVITGTSEDDREDAYLRKLQQQARRLGLDRRRQVLFAGRRFGNNRGTAADGSRIYALGDGYAGALACTYFSLYEGFGNAFVEAVVARRPIFVNDYEPVYWPDIGSLGFETVMIRGGQLSDQAVEQAREVLADPALRRRMSEHNFELGRRHFSYQALERILGRLFEVV